MLKLWDKFKDKCKKVFHKDKKHVEREHFPLDLEKGLTSEQVQQRFDEGLINKAKKHVPNHISELFMKMFSTFSISFYLSSLLR